MDETDEGTTVRGDDEEEHVFFATGDCAGFFRRAAAIAVDLLVLAAILVAYFAVLAFCGMLSDEGNAPPWGVAPFIVIAFLYLTLLKRSRFRTPGYRVTGLRIVDLKGRPPSMLLMSVRLLWWVLGPINFPLDFLFLTSDARRQTVRDKLIGTYVVLKDATPAGSGHKYMEGTGFMGWMLLCPVVRPVAPGSRERRTASSEVVG